MKMRRFACLWLAVLLLFSGCSCGGSGKEQDAAKEERMDASAAEPEGAEEEREEAAADELNETETETGSEPDEAEIEKDVPEADEYQVLLDKGAAFEKAGEEDKAMAAYELAVRMDPERTEAYIAKGTLQLKLGKIGEAYSSANKALEVDPSLPEGWILRCRIDVDERYVEGFEEAILYAEICEADIHQYAAEFGMLYVECGRYEDAVYYFAMADLSQMTDAEKNGYRKALIASGQKERAGELGLTDMAFRDPVLDGAFERGELGLEETSIGGLEITADNIVFSEEARQALNYADEETFREELEEGFESGQWEIRVASLAPAGNSGILDISGVAAAWYEGQVRPLYPSPDRGVEDAFENLEEYTSRISSHFESFLGNEGAVYSPDGRYAAVFNVRNTLKTANFFQDPILIDLSTGELILTETWPNGLSEEGSGAVTAASFSSDGRYFYYSLYGGFEDSTGVGIARLFRYELETGETELCKGYTYDEKKDRDYWLYYPHLVELSDGSFLQLNDSNRMNDITGVVRTRMEKGEWIIEQADFSLPIFQFYPDRLDYSLNSGYAAITGRSMRMSDLNQNAFGLQIFRPEEAYEGLDRYIFIGKEDGQAVIFTPEEYSSLQKALSEALTEAKESEDEGAVSQWYQELPYQFIMNSVLSPDGQYLLLVTKSIEIDSPAFHLLLLRLEDLSVREVSGVDPVTLESQEIEFLKYMEWNTDQLVFRTMDGFRTFRFRY